MKKDAKRDKLIESMFSDVKTSFLDYDPAYFIQNNLTLDGEPFSVLNNGWKFMADIYRYIALEATRDNGKPVVICKGRQIGATVMAGALDLYFTNSGLFTNPPAKVAHLFPAIALVKRFSQAKLEDLIRSAKNDFINKNKLILTDSNAVDNITMKQFKTGTLWIESIGADGDRVRGMSLDMAFFDECFPYNQNIETLNGKIEIGKLFDLYAKGEDLPLVKTYNEMTSAFEFKKVKKAWQKGERNLLSIRMNEQEVKCTPEHRFLTTNGWTRAEDLSLGDLVKSAPDNNGFFIKDMRGYSLAIVRSISKVDMPEVVYDIEVEDNHNFIVTSSGEHIGGPIAHNCQDMPGLAIGNATKTLTAAKYGPRGKGVQVFFGTPKQRGSYFNKIWEMSDKRYYQFGCKNCNEHYFFYHSDSQDMWKEIWIDEYTIKCPLCGTEQHKIDAIERGKWTPTRNAEEASFVGFHINQLYIPYFKKQNIIDLMPEFNPTQSERVWNNEVIGEFYSGSGMPLTKQDIHENCMDNDRSFSRKISSRDKSTYLGVDWGGKVDNDHVNRGQSFSCVVILSATPDGTLLVEHAHKLRSQAFSYKKDTIIECYRRFGVQRGVSDWFFGQDVVHDLQMVYRDKFLGAQGSGALIKPLKFREDELIISYNKDLLIEELFDKIRKGKVRFPGKSYENVDWLIEHCTSMESSTSLISGQQVKTFKKGSTPNDGLMALIYAYMAWKFDVTTGFTVKPGFEKEGSLLKPVLAYSPKLRI